MNTNNIRLSQVKLTQMVVWTLLMSLLDAFCCVASVLRGKNKPTFTPHTDTGDFVIVSTLKK